MAAHAMDEPLVSVVVPAYNAEPYIETTLRSVLAQSFREFEIIVVDDCSSDATVQIVQRLAAEDARIRCIGLTQNRGAPAGPRNIGVRAARGRWIAFVDADDIWHPEKLRCQMEALALTGARFCSTQMLDFVDASRLAFTAPTAMRIERIGFFKQLVKPRTPTSSVVVDKELVAKYPFNECPSFKAREDLDCWLHCHEELGSSIKVRHPLLGYRIIPGQISGNKATMVRRHLHVMRRYRLRSGRPLGAGAFVFTLSHFLFAIYYRVLKKTL